MPASAVNSDSWQLDDNSSHIDEAVRPSAFQQQQQQQRHHRLAEVKRSDSLRSQSSSASDSLKRVSFNDDVRVKRIPNKSKLAVGKPQLQQHQQQLLQEEPQDQFANFKLEAPPQDPGEVAEEAERILQQLSQVECSVSAIAPSNLSSAKAAPPPPPPPPPAAPPPSLDHESGQPQRGRSGSLEPTNPLYGLHALNNLDIAVNGKEVNSMPSYRDLRRRGFEGGSGGGSDDNSSTTAAGTATLEREPRYETFHHLNPLPVPPKPPRKAPSTSPPSLRRAHNRNNNRSDDYDDDTTDATMTHYARPATVVSPTSQLDSFLNSRKRFMAGSMDNNNDDSAIASGGDGGGTDDASGSNPSYHRFSGGPPPPPPVRHRSSPPRLASPSRTCMTDTEILRSPTEVLYAVSEKRRLRDSNSDVKSASVQTMRSELRQNPSSSLMSGNGYYAKNPNRPSRNSSREDLLTDDASYVSSSRRSVSLQQPLQQPQHSRRAPTYGSGSRFGQQTARSLERFLDSDNDKENAFKTRIQVISPDRIPSPEPSRRKPYKTMINTATDNIIQYRVGSSENLRFTDYYTLGRNNSNNNMDDGNNEHYKVPKNKAPVIDDYYQRQQQMHLQQQQQQPQQQRRRYLYREREDSDLSSTSYVAQQYRASSGGRTQPQFSSTGLVKSADANGRRHHRAVGSSRELDREGRSIRRDAGSRHYSGCSTSPDREASPERYARPNVNSSYAPRSSIMSASPDVSPTRPPRSRSSPVRELGRAISRSISGRRGDVEEIPRVRNGSTSLTREQSMTSSRHHHPPAVTQRRRERFSNGEPNGEDRLARFTEYRGDEADGGGGSGGLSDRERGRSLPPGATIESMRDFYKSSQFKSMYALPPSPSRPAPVLERSQSRRQQPPRVSISEGEITDDPAVGGHGGRPEPVRPVRGVPRPSTKRPAPSPPGMVPVRRVVSSDRESVRTVPTRIESVRRVGPNVGPPRRVIANRRGSSVDNLDSSYSESEGLHVDRDQDKAPLGEFGRRWSAHQSDIDSDYRRELATSGGGGGGNITGNGLHHEARTRDGGSILTNGNGRLAGGRNNVRMLDDHPDEIMQIDDDDMARPVVGGGVSAREEERRKVLEIEEERIRMEREAQLRRNGGVAGQSAANGAPGGRIARTAHVHSAALRRGGLRAGGGTASGPEVEITYGANGAPITAGNGGAKLNRYDQHRSASRVRRTASSVNGNGNPAAVGAVRREIVSNARKKLPGGSLTSSVNSSESERGSHAGQSAVSRATDASRRSVYLHAAAVVDIPSANERPSRAVSADHHPVAPISSAPSMSNLKNSKKISRSISLLAPWKPKNYKDKFEVIHYDNRNVYANPPTSVTVGPGGTTVSSSGGGPSSAVGKPPRPPVPPVTRRVVPDKRSASSSDLLRDTQQQQQQQQLHQQQQQQPTPASVSVLERRAQTLQKPTSSSSKVSRSVSMPKDSRLAGWFKKRKRS